MVEQSFESLEVGYQSLLDSARENIIVYSTLKLPEEAVGIIDDTGDVYPLINQRRASDEFAVSVRHVKEAIEILNARGRHGVAIYHSHLNTRGYPSAFDTVMFKRAVGTIFIIHGTDIISAWTCEDETSEPEMIAKVPSG